MQCSLEHYKLLGLRSVLVLADSLIVEQPSKLEVLTEHSVG